MIKNLLKDFLEEQIKTKAPDVRTPAQMAYFLADMVANDFDSEDDPSITNIDELVFDFQIEKVENGKVSIIGSRLVDFEGVLECMRDTPEIWGNQFNLPPEKLKGQTFSFPEYFNSTRRSKSVHPDLVVDKGFDAYVESARKLGLMK